MVSSKICSYDTVAKSVKPVADWYAKRGGDDMRTDNFLRAVYQSLKPSAG
jgi:hypothetical protein